MIQKKWASTVFNFFFHFSEINLPVCCPKMSQNWCGHFLRAWGGRTRLILIKKSAFSHIWHLIFKETVANRRQDNLRWWWFKGPVHLSQSVDMFSVLTMLSTKAKSYSKRKKEEAIIDFRINFRHLVEYPTTQDGLHDHDQWVLRFRWGL